MDITKTAALLRHLIDWKKEQTEVHEEINNVITLLKKDLRTYLKVTATKADFKGALLRFFVMQHLVEWKLNANELGINLKAQSKDGVWTLENMRLVKV